MPPGVCLHLGVDWPRRIVPLSRWSRLTSPTTEEELEKARPRFGDIPSAGGKAPLDLEVRHDRRNPPAENLHFSSARRRHCGLDSRSPGPPPPSNTTGQGLHSPIQSRSLQNQQQGTVTRLLDLETRIADALRMPHSVTQSPSSNNHHCQTATTRRPPIGPANGPRLISPCRLLPTSPSVSIVGCPIVRLAQQPKGSRGINQPNNFFQGGFLLHLKNQMPSSSVHPSYCGPFLVPGYGRLHHTDAPTHHGIAYTRHDILPPLAKLSKSAKPASSLPTLPSRPSNFRNSLPSSITRKTPTQCSGRRPSLTDKSLYLCHVPRPTLVWVLGECPDTSPSWDTTAVGTPLSHPHRTRTPQGTRPPSTPPWPLPSFFAAHPSAVTATPQCHAEHSAPPPATRVRKSGRKQVEVAHGLNCCQSTTTSQLGSPTHANGHDTVSFLAALPDDAMGQLWSANLSKCCVSGQSITMSSFDDLDLRLDFETRRLQLRPSARSQPEVQLDSDVSCTSTSSWLFLPRASRRSTSQTQPYLTTGNVRRATEKGPSIGDSCITSQLRSEFEAIGLSSMKARSPSYYTQREQYGPSSDTLTRNVRCALLRLASQPCYSSANGKLMPAIGHSSHPDKTVIRFRRQQTTLLNFAIFNVS
ncbi:uncharacterized protein CLUP02_01820 [Colletotrichum lupini]|uniref:Uncharacterized protein n=1 Tax=Colletotrichum lupini TaxID=145971 RepID=A0A9Q8SER5_9PEZI|nr:uncharacterized protein CLUP02_01820 [Colletotrichum lupini]UQC75167.1 hypothetical protein CLUP02_01820 [Colletotrichum lupini]